MQSHYAMSVLFCQSIFTLKFKTNVNMINVEKFVLKNEVESNPLVKIHLKAMKWFGYMLFENQRLKRLHCFRGVVFTVSFILFNITQVKRLLEEQLFPSKPLSNLE